MRTIYKLIPVLCILGVCCETESELYKEMLLDYEKISDLIMFTNLEPDSIPADNASSAQITVRIHPGTDSIYREVEFSTDNGTFNNGSSIVSKSVNIDGYCSVALTGNSKTGPARIQAKVKNIVIDTSVYFYISYPEDFLLTASDYVIESGNSGSLIVDCYRQVGDVSENIKVNFSIQEHDTVDTYPVVDQFGAISNESAQVTVVNPLNATGLHTFVAKAPISEADTMTKHIQIYFK